VLAAEALAGLALEAGGYYVDATFGRGGHTALILQALGREGRLLALDRDPEAQAAARSIADSRFSFFKGKFGSIGKILDGMPPASGMLFDLGVSSPQLDDPARGFSFRADGPLDMRMDPTRGEPVSAWLARAGLDEIRQVIATFGEERFARRVAQAIIARRGERALTTTGELARLVAGAVRTREPGKHPATRTFQALRMYINDELGQLERGLSGALARLAPGGRLAVISFHSLEDRLVKRFMQRESQPDPALKSLPVLPAQARVRLKLIGRKQRPTAAELLKNPRARSALLRVAERLP